ncbi:MAG: GGDEF domain-containing protein [Geobacter sp.]|nr:GGDEF domain-containing protein [Geobacter sp.]
MASKLNKWQYIWLVIVLLYGSIVLNKAIKEYVYIYDSRHYDKVINAMDQSNRDLYFAQKCNTIDTEPDAPEPLCYSLTTIDSGTMYFDIATSRQDAERIQKNYNDVAYNFMIFATIKFLTLFSLLWLIPSVIFYPFWEWFVDGYNRSNDNDLNGRDSSSTGEIGTQRIENLMTRYFNFLDRKGTVFNFALGLGFAVLFGAFDILAPSKYSFMMMYLFPIALTTWFAGQTAGFIIVMVCIAFWSYTTSQFDLLALTWNIISTLSIYLMISVMLTKLRFLWEKDKILSRTDPLTGVMNRRAFDEIVEYEIMSLQRQNSPLSLAYIDLDNFKQVNDHFGHKKGDELLKAIVACFSNNLRRTDIIARMGGDEFVVFFPGTDHNAVKLVMQKLMVHLRLLSEGNNWPITFSIGVITSVDSNCDLEEIISLADKLMYEVKQSGKDNINYFTTQAAEDAKSAGQRSPHKNPYLVFQKDR